MLAKEKLQRFMMIASQKNMTGGDYVFIAVHPFAGNMMSLQNRFRDFAWILPWILFQGDKEAENTKNAMFFGTKEEMAKAYQGLFVLMPQVIHCFFCCFFFLISFFEKK